MKKQNKQLDLTGKTIFVGIDVHKKTWHLTALHGDLSKSKSIESDAKHLHTYLNNRYPNATFKACYEAGHFGFKIKEDLDKLGIETIVVNPADIPTTDKEKRTKTDPVDSKKLAQHLKNGVLNGIYVPDRSKQEQRSLYRRRADIVRKITRVKNQLKSDLSFYGIKIPSEYAPGSRSWSQNFIKWLEEINFISEEGNLSFRSRIKELQFLLEEKKILTKAINNTISKRYKKENELLKSVPGIGTIAIATILIEGFGVERFRHRDQYLSYIGLIPNEHSSGESQKIGRLTRRHNKYLRMTFIECAWVAIREDPALTEYYNNCCLRMKPTQAIVKVARKLATRSRYILKNNQSYAIGLVA